MFDIDDSLIILLYNTCSFFCDFFVLSALISVITNSGGTDEYS